MNARATQLENNIQFYEARLLSLARDLSMINEKRIKAVIEIEIGHWEKKENAVREEVSRVQEELKQAQDLLEELTIKK